MVKKSKNVLREIVAAGAAICGEIFYSDGKFSELWEIFTIMVDIDKWVEIARECKYLPENDLKVCFTFYRS